MYLCEAASRHLNVSFFVQVVNIFCSFSRRVLLISLTQSELAEYAVFYMGCLFEDTAP